MSLEQTPNSGAVGNLWEDPIGTKGFEFIGYTAEDTGALGQFLEAMEGGTP